ncbi:MAG: hypothetical protein PHE09_05540 [Oscillospiraceae bacterium]|nr:hypothetical protein [Oscillospiraceae bacterium]
MAREGYLVHQGEETIHSEKLKHVPKTPKEKWQNFWYYHKWHVLIGIAVALFAAYFIHSAVTQVNPDYQVGLITEKPVSNSVIQDMEYKLQLGAKDRNGDGKVVVQVNSYTLGTGNSDPQVTEANVTRLMGDLNLYSDMLFFCDDKGYAYIQKRDGWDVSKTKMAMPNVMKYSGDALTANMRVLFPDHDKKYQEHKTYWDASLKVYQNAMSAK